MKSILAAFIAIVALCGCQAASGPPPQPPAASRGARVVSVEAVDARMDKVTISSPAAGGERSVWVIKPEAWKPGSSGWRALYLLHGCCSGGAFDWVRSGEVAKLTAGLDAVVIVPDGEPMGWYTNWVKGPAWETYHLTEMPPLVEPRYGVGGRRAIAGFSMGGYGAMHYAARHPGMFEAAAAFSGVLDIRDDISGYQEFFRNNGADTADVWGDPSTWAAHNPADLVSGLKGMRLYVSCGDGDPGPFDDARGGYDGTEAALMRQNANFAAAAAKAGVKLTTDFYGNGTHTWPYWIRSLKRALPILLPQ